MSPITTEDSLGGKRAAWTAWSFAAASFALTTLGLLLLVLNRDAAGVGNESWASDTVVALFFPGIGALIASRRPRNAIGWIFCISGFLSAVTLFVGEYGGYGLATNPGSLPLAVWLAWIGTWAWIPSVGLQGTLLLLLFPNGRMPSRRWLPVARSAVVAIVVASAVVAVVPWDVLEPHSYASDNPIGLGGVVPITLPVAVAAAVLFTFATVASVTSLILRLRRSRGVERQQLKWFTYGGALLAATFPLGGVWPQTSDWSFFAPALLPLAAAIAILKHRLYDIDRIINRTLVYAALTAFLALAYLGLVIVLQSLFSDRLADSQVAVAGSTLAVAALFRPARARIQSFIDRRFYRSRYDAARLLEDFGGRVRNEVDLDALTADLLSVVRDALQPAHASVVFLSRRA